MNFIILLNFINLFFTGILAGIEIVIHYGLRGPSETLDDRPQLQLRQALVMKLRVLVPAFFAPAAVSGIAITFLNVAAPGFVFRCAGVLAVLIWILIRIIGTVPINSATVSWQLASPPADWKEQVNHAERFHIVGVWAVILMFVFFLASVALQMAAH